MEEHELKPLQRKPSVMAQEASSLLSSTNLSSNGDSLPPSQNDGFVSRLGKYQFAMLLASFASCFVCIAFLTFLWASDTNNTAWRWIILRGWATRSVTIASLVLRWATGAQAMTCTCMIAATLLQVGAVSLSRSAAVSITRFDNTGPWSLLNLMGSKWPSGSTLISLLTLLLCLTTLFLQFSSTILLSHVGLGYLPVKSVLEQTYYTLNTSGMAGYRGSEEISFLHSTPSGYPAFAEYIFDENHATVTTLRGFEASSSLHMRDTGTVLRAFLPIRDANERNLTAEYAGIATIVDARVVCMKPTLTNLKWFSDGETYRLSGEAKVDNLPEGHSAIGGSSVNMSDISFKFDCGMNIAFWRNYTTMFKEWPLSMCLGTYTKWDYGIYSIFGDSHRARTNLILNGTFTGLASNWEGSEVWETVALTNTTVPNLLEDFPTDASVTVQVTLCMTAFAAQDVNVTAYRKTPFPAEPTVSWDVNKAVWAADDVLRQLDSKRSIEERGIFELDISLYDGGNITFSYDTHRTNDLATVAALDKVKDGISVGRVNKLQYTVFSQMAATTGNPALALQAYFTTLCAIAYYDRIPTFDVAAPSTRVLLTQVTRPLGWAGYIIVLSVLVVHLLLVVIITLIFLRTGKLSRVGNAWAVVSQLLGPETEAWIRDVDTLDDKAVKKWLKARGKHGVLVQLEEVEGRVVVVSKDKMS